MYPLHPSIYIYIYIYKYIYIFIYLFTSHIYIYITYIYIYITYIYISLIYIYITYIYIYISLIYIYIYLTYIIYTYTYTYICVYERMILQQPPGMQLPSLHREFRWCWLAFFSTHWSDRVLFTSRTNSVQRPGKGRQMITGDLSTGNPSRLLGENWHEEKTGIPSMANVE